VVTPDTPFADFDLVVYGPDGNPVGRAADPAVVGDPSSVERVEADVTASGVYTIVVDAMTTARSTYHGEATLTG
jgi:hypothetical protein